MKTILLILFSFAITAFSQTESSLDEQLKLKYSDQVIEYIKTNDTQRYNFYLSELKSSFEFVELRPDWKYISLTAYDFINKQEKPAPDFTEATFSLYNYKFIRHKSEDLTYRIPGTNEGILIYSKERFTAKNKLP